MSQGPVQLVLAGPDGNTLLTWAAAPDLRLDTAIVFFDAGDQPFETLRLPAAYCVGYREEFVRGDTQDDAYRCILTLVDPAGWTLTPGGLASAYVAPAGHSPGEPGAGATALSSDPSASQPIGGSSSPSPMDLDSDYVPDSGGGGDDDPADDFDGDPEDEAEDDPYAYLEDDKRDL